MSLRKRLSRIISEPYTGPKIRPPLKPITWPRPKKKS